MTAHRTLSLLSALSIVAGGLGASLTTPTPAAAATPEPLNVAIELHVENKNPGLLPAQATAIEVVAREADAHDMAISFGIADGFFRTTSTWGATQQTSTLSAIAGYTDAGGAQLHEIDAHLDWTYSATDLAAQLDGVEAAFESLGFTMPTTTSGTCTNDTVNWVEDAIDPVDRDGDGDGDPILVAAGAVVDCERSLDSSLREYGSIRDGLYEDSCTPMTCHGAAPAADDTARLRGWTTSTTSEWIVDAGSSGDLSLLSSYVDLPFTCLAEGVSRANCGSSGTDVNLLRRAARADAAAFVASLQRALTDCGVVQPGDTYYVTWSMNTIPAEAYVTTLFDTIDAQLATAGLDSLVEFTTLTDAALEA